MMENQPAFSDAPPMNRAKRIVLGIVCSLVSLGILFSVCYTLELFKKEATKEMSGLRSRISAPTK